MHGGTYCTTTSPQAVKYGINGESYAAKTPDKSGAMDFGMSQKFEGDRNEEKIRAMHSFIPPYKNGHTWACAPISQPSVCTFIRADSRQRMASR
jgi:hypothetical protein